MLLFAPANRQTPQIGVGSLNALGNEQGFGDHVVSVGELVRGVNIALTRQPLASCQPFDTNGDGAVKVDELIRAVRAALDGCAG